MLAVCLELLVLEVYTVLQSIVIESSAAKQINEEKKGRDKRERHSWFLIIIAIYTYQERSVVLSFWIK